MRAATMADSEMLRAWRNDAATREASKDTAYVEQAPHETWMKFNVQHGYPQHYVMIAESPDFGSVGVVRFDAMKKDIMAYRVSITIAPRHRRKGFATDILDRACDIMSEYALFADVRFGNEGSIKAFERCGFKVIGNEGDFFKYKKDPQ
jgi:RimJ/RimL family protein N-acetyltransferase